VGIDEGYEVIGKENKTMHDADGNPLIDKSKFPDMKGLSDGVHSRHENMTISWYLNSCYAGGEINPSFKNYQGDIRNLFALGFDGVKFDGYGSDVWII
jgi:hypothetical protein